MIETARKHGPFDRRYPVRPKLATSWEPRADAKRLEWSAFLARFFPNRRRHDFEALAAYEARVPVAAGSSAELAWESEGGAVTERGAR
jgi:hypothetical protein